MDTQRKVIVGYDLCEDYSRISCYSYKKHEAITISPNEGNEEGLIPTVLCYRTDTRQWLFGEDAIIGAKNGSGILVKNLLSNLENDREIDIMGVKYSAQAIMDKFLRRTLTLVRDYFPTQPITKLVITVRNTKPDFVEKLYSILSLLGIGRDRAHIISHEDAYLYYALYQDRSLWMNDVGLFDYGQDGLSYYQIRINRWSKPMIASLEKHDFSDSLEADLLQQKNADAAYVFENLANSVLYKQTVTTLYFTGKGFEGGWADKVMKSLCIGRRVFYGQNLYTKGACYAAKELSGDKKLQDVLLLNDDMVTCSLALRVYKDGRINEVMLLEAGELWYKAGRSYELIPDGATQLDIVQRNLMSREIIYHKIALDKFSVNTNRTSRLKIEFTCSDKASGVIKLTDLGFGEFFKGTGRSARYTIKLTADGQWQLPSPSAGKMILCSGVRASKPYYFVSGGIRVYSIEELCYFLYNYIYMIDEIGLGDKLFDWIDTELNLPERADRLRQLTRQKADLKTIITVILCSCDYYTEKEIKTVIRLIDDILKMPIIKRRCLKAADLLKKESYTEAVREYEQIIHSDEAVELTPEEFGDIYHNLAVAKAHTTGVKEASGLFLEAYERNNRDESLRQYLYSLLLMGDTAQFRKRIEEFRVDEDLKNSLLEYVRIKDKEATMTDEYKRLMQLSGLKEQSDPEAFYNIAKAIINEWKEQYGKR